jgi:hypothetical protein
VLSVADYKKLSLDKKVELLYHKGDFVMSIRYYHYKINLYLLENFYVEVFVDHKSARIVRISFLDSDGGRLPFYSDQIKLPIDIF